MRLRFECLGARVQGFEVWVSGNMSAIVNIRDTKGTIRGGDRGPSCSP